LRYTISGLPEGRKARLTDIRSAAAADPDLQNLNKEREEELKNELRAKRLLEETGMRASHTAVGLDVRHTVDHIKELVCGTSSLSSRIH
jgi:hypothetical protein